MATGQTYTDDKNQLRDMTTGAVLDPTANPVIPPKQVGVLSSERGLETVQKKQQSLAAMTPIPSPAPTGAGTIAPPTNVQKNNASSFSPTETAKPQEQKLTLINPTSGQSVTIYNQGINKNAVQSLLGQGYAVSEVLGEYPSYLQPQGAATTKASGASEQATADLAAATKEVDTMRQQMEQYKISDAELSGTIDSINKNFEVRTQQMEDINRRRLASIETTGIRLGSQYTGGKGGMFGGIIAEEERQAGMRISELDSQRQGAILAAKQAQRDNNWKVFNAQVGLAEDRRKELQQAVVKMNELTIANNKKIAEEDAKLRTEQLKKEQEQLEQERQVSKEGVMRSLIQQGITDPLTALDFLNYDESGKQVGDFTADEVSKFYKDFVQKDKEVKIDSDIQKWRDAKTQGIIPETTSYFDFTMQDAAAKKAQRLASGEAGGYIDPVTGKTIKTATSGDADGNPILDYLGVPTDRTGKVRVKQSEARTIAKDIYASDAYKAMGKARDSLDFLSDFEQVFKKTGATSAVFSPRDNANLASKYESTLLNLKEFFNLGVLNGPDRETLEGVLPNPTNRSAALTVGSLGIYKPSAATKSGLNNMKAMVEKTVDDRYATIRNQYSLYSADDIPALNDIDRTYLEAKRKLDPGVDKFINENPNMSVSDVVQVINKRL